MSLQEGGKSSDILLFTRICHFLISLVNSISRKPEEYSVARAKTMPFVKANSGLVNAAEKEYAGKKVRLIYQKSVMIVGLMLENWANFGKTPMRWTDETI